MAQFVLSEKYLKFRRYYLQWRLGLTDAQVNQIERQEREGPLERQTAKKQNYKESPFTDGDEVGSMRAGCLCNRRTFIDGVEVQNNG